MKTDSTLDQKSTPAGEVDSGGCAPMSGSLRFRVIAYNPETNYEEDCGIIEGKSFGDALGKCCHYNYLRRMIPIDFPSPSPTPEMTSPHRNKAMIEETNNMPRQDVADSERSSERSGDRRLSNCSACPPTRHGKMTEHGHMQIAYQACEVCRRLWKEKNGTSDGFAEIPYHSRPNAIDDESPPRAKP